MLTHTATVIAFFVATFGVQATNHFVLSVEHYASEPIIDPNPLIIGGLIAIFLQGTILSVLYKQLRSQFTGLRGAVAFSWIMGLFLCSYIALAEPSKYLINAKLSWTLTEATASFVQFTLFGLLLGFIHNRRDARFS
jgi:hypothetical protein